MNEDNFLDTPIYYQKTKISHFVPKAARVSYLQVPKLQLLDDFKKALIESLRNPNNTFSLENMITSTYRVGKPIVILIDDHTRPNVHTRLLLPILKKYLLEFGVKRNDIWLLIATGTHIPPTPEQIKRNILGSLFEDWKDYLWIHDCDDIDNHEYLGESSLGTPILIDKRTLGSSIIIPLSDSEYHYFAGVAGSVKLFVPGVSARKTVRVNHSRIFDIETGFRKECQMGNIEGNIAIGDIREIVHILIKKHGLKVFVIDAILHNGNFIAINSGDPLSIHEKALQELSKIRNVPIHEKADIVIVSKPSVDFYQAGKGINAASHAVKQGGTIILLAECSEGYGPADYFETMERVKNLSFKEAMQWVIKNKCSENTIEIGIQNAVDIFRILQLTEGHIFVISQMNTGELQDIFRVSALPSSSPQEALKLFIERFLKKNPKALIYVFEDYNILPILTP